MDKEKKQMIYEGRTIEELLEENKNLNALIQNVPGGVMCCDADTEDGLELLEYSDGFLKLLGYTSEELKERYDNKFQRMIYEPDWEKTIQSVNEQMSKGNTKKIEYRLICGDGTLKVIYDQGQLVRRNGRDVFYCILTDVTEQRAIMKELKLSLERHRIILEQARDVIFEWDMESDTILWSDNWEKKFGYRPFESDVEVGILKSEHIYPEDRNVLVELCRRLQDNTTYAEEEARLQKLDGTFIWCRIRATLQTSKVANKKKVIGVIMDIDDEKKKAEMLKERAEKDTLTGVYNKGTMQTFANRYFSNMKQGEKAAFFMIDIDDFKYVNDFYGHLSGDALLAEIAAGLKRIFRRHDIIGRIGGDEFAVIMRNIPDKEIVGKKADEIMFIFKEYLKGEKCKFSASIGIAFLPDHGIDFETIYKNADIALYKAKASGKNNWKVYESGLQMEDVNSGTYAAKRSLDNFDTIWQGESGIISYVFSSLYSAPNVEKGIEGILKIVGTKYGASRSYIFECTDDGKCGYKTFEWCKDGIELREKKLQGLSKKIKKDYYSNFDKNGIFYCENVKKLPEKYCFLEEEEGVQSMLQCLIQDAGEVRGFIGFDSCEAGCYWTKSQIDTLAVIAQIISVFLAKSRMKALLSKLQPEQDGK
ncbi:MAG: diguanylate cyclase [Faecalicatena sp.]|uniref:sensor domain-containing diguanylate cyclase n=1 Tax=Faecalicatena sp. TaxID=2005360 RepID=UPI002584DE6E|nr:diguanylate cyclase [Faecalicatena sp.]MCI6465602.1 diguanylate cyclase [Faecalicatena sp.]MDY5617434.1 diguanylate cyclase [Lachnospiraceae bacterium]